ncbi:MAG: HAD-IA family hydrolase [Kiloniellales bacterium]
MRSSVSLVLFDLDGTLVDSQHAVVMAMTEAWRAHGLGDPPQDQVRRVIGLSLKAAIAALLPDGAPVAPERVADSFRQAFLQLRQQSDHIEPLYPGATVALDALETAGRLLGIASGKSRRGVIATLAQHGLTERFATLKSADDGPGKPAPDMVVQAMAEVGAGPRHTAVVGDTVFDMQMAMGAGVQAIGVAWGYHRADELRAAGARRVVHSFAELPAAVAATTPGPRR